MTQSSGATGARVKINQLVGDHWLVGEDEKTLALTSPVDGATLGEVSSASADQIDAAVAAARAAGGDWARRSAFERAEVLLSVGAEIERRKEEIATALTLEQGKPYHSEALPEIDDLLSNLRNN